MWRVANDLHNTVIVLLLYHLSIVLPLFHALNFIFRPNNCNRLLCGAENSEKVQKEKKG